MNSSEDRPGTDEIEGRVTGIRFHNEENLFTIARLETDRGEVAILGNMGRLDVGERIRAQGDFEVHPRWGEQFKVRTYQVVLPSTLKGVEDYLGSGLVKGVGEAIARRIVEVFGEDTLRVLDEEPERLLKVHGIGRAKLAQIIEDWSKKKAQRETMMFLSGHGVGPGHATKILAAYGENAVPVLRHNPYRLAVDITGIGFATADAIGRKLGIPADAPVRLQAGLLHALSQAAGNGHFYLPWDLLAEEGEKLLEIDRDTVEKELAHLEAESLIISEPLPDGESAVYLPAFYMAESGLANRLKAFLSVPMEGPAITPDDILAAVHQRLAIALSDEQLAVAAGAQSHRMCVITGGPGTGKTTLVRSLILLYESRELRIRLAAPTGRAAKRLTEVTGREATTIHRLLHYDFMSDSFTHNEEEPLEADVIIIDEASMVDAFLMYHLVKAVPMDAVLVLVGDVSQLPPVGPGNTLKDIISSGRVPVFHLTRIFRQARESLIVQNAHRINEGLMPETPSVPKDQRLDFYFTEEDDPAALADKAIELVINRIPKAFGFDPKTEVQIITPMHKGPAGTLALNERLQERINPHAPSIERMGKSFRLGDKVMQLKNNYVKEVYNGDIGMVEALDREAGELLVEFDDGRVSYGFDELDELTLAYAISVHKSQGSEYPAVVFLLSLSHYVMLQRNLLYTGITRAKKLLVLMGGRRALSIAVGNDRPSHRLTRLAHRLKEGGDLVYDLSENGGEE